MQKRLGRKQSSQQKPPKLPTISRGERLVHWIQGYEIHNKANKQDDFSLGWCISFLTCQSCFVREWTIQNSSKIQNLFLKWSYLHGPFLLFFTQERNVTKSPSFTVLELPNCLFIAYKRKSSISLLVASPKAAALEKA